MQRRATGRGHRHVAFCAALLLAADARPAEVAGQERPIRVDLELVLAVDVSGSVNARELDIQRRGYAAALVDDDVLAAIARGYHGQIALSYVEWAGADHQRIVVGWTLVRSRADTEAFAAAITGPHDPKTRLTSISGAIDFAADLFGDNGFEAPRKVIDISGDGPSNDGRTVTFARDDAVAKGVTINGLPLMTREGVGGVWYLDHLDDYYWRCVVGGNNAFVIPVNSLADFPGAVRQKLLLELSGIPPPRRFANPPTRVWRVVNEDDDCRHSDAIWGPSWWYQPRR